MANLRKQIPSPVLVYNIFNQIHMRYFSNTFIRGGKIIKNAGTEKYLTFFVENHYRDFRDLKDLKHYILWMFQEKGRVPINVLHRYIGEWKKRSVVDMSTFAVEVAQYINENGLSWASYIATREYSYPHIIEHYIGQQNIPFELIVHLRIPEKVNDAKKMLLRGLLNKEFYDMARYVEKAEKNKNFIAREIERTKSLTSER